MAESPIC